MRKHELEEFFNSLRNTDSEHRHISCVCLRVSLLRSKLDNLREVLNTTIELAKAGLFTAFMALIIFHPWIVISYLMAINQIGNILLNYTLLGLFILDIAVSIFAGIIMEGKREGAF